MVLSLSESVIPSDLTIQLEYMEAELSAARAENEHLKAETDALQKFNDQAAYLSSILARADLSCCFIPSARVAPHPIQAIVDKVLESAWGGKHPPEEWMRAYAQLTPEFLIQSELQFMERLRNTLTSWGSAQFYARLELETSMSTAIRVRSKISQILCQAAPLLLIEFWRRVLPPLPSGVDGQLLQEQMVRIAASMYLSEQQIEAIREAWGEYRCSMSIAHGQIAAAKQGLAMVQLHRDALSGGGALTSTTRGSPGCASLEDESIMSQFSTESAALNWSLKDAQVRSVVAYGKLAATLCGVVSWRQFVTFYSLQSENPCGVCPVPDSVLFCQVLEANEWKWIIC